MPTLVKTPGDSGSSSGPRVIDTYTHVVDLYPTFTDYAGTETVAGEPLLGGSAKPLLDGTSDSVGTDEFGMELFGHRVYREGDWKLVYAPAVAGGTGRYALYDLAADPGETADVSTQNPEVVQRLSTKWDQYARENGVVPAPFEAVEAAAPRIASLMYSIDWTN